MRKETYVKAGDKIRCINKDRPPARHKAIYTVKSASNNKFVIEGMEQHSWINPLNHFNVFELYGEENNQSRLLKLAEEKIKERIYVKVNDMIRCVSPHYNGVHENEIYTVKSLDKGNFRIEGGGIWSNPLDPEVFVLYKKAPKFKIGDKVKILGKIGDYDEIGWSDFMKEYIGQIGIVLSDRILEDNSVKVIFNDKEYWYFHEDSLELIEDNQPIKQEWEDYLRKAKIQHSMVTPSALLYPSLSALDKWSKIGYDEKLAFTNKKRKFKKLQ